METNLKFNSAICTSREQSERLLALGLKKETADCVVSSIGSKDRLIHTEGPIYVMESLSSKRIPNYPAWSLHRMVQMMPSAVYQGESIRYFMIEQGHNVGYWYFGEDECELCKIWSRKDLYNNIIDSIEWLIEKGYFNKEYLEE